ncbi:MAG: PIN domain-containing protein [Candidatus Eremiobacterota bacterium]
MNKFIKIIFTIIMVTLSALIGYLISLGFNHYFQLEAYTFIFIIAGCTLLFGIIGFWVSPYLIRFFNYSVEFVRNYIQKYTPQELIAGAIGLILGLIVNSLLLRPLYLLFLPFSFIGDNLLFTISNFIHPLVVIFMTAFFAYLGIIISINVGLHNVLSSDKLKKDIPGMDSGIKDFLTDEINSERFKILDTSVIIDGRILDICRTGFLAGVIIISRFVLQELQHIADSSDSLKRNRGRRGLDVLNKMRKDPNIPIHIYEKDYQNIQEVDAKLIRLAKDINGKIITNDYNLNKVAELHGVLVLNINELANALKPVVLPGEEMSVHIIKDGKEFGQGVAYLDDGTMIVVEGGKKFIGSTLQVLVTSVLQTVAGKMIFAKPK